MLSCVIIIWYQLHCVGRNKSLHAFMINCFWFRIQNPKSQGKKEWKFLSLNSIPSVRRKSLTRSWVLKSLKQVSFISVQVHDIIENYILQIKNSLIYFWKFWSLICAGLQEFLDGSATKLQEEFDKVCGFSNTYQLLCESLMWTVEEVGIVRALTREFCGISAHSSDSGTQCNHAVCFLYTYIMGASYRPIEHACMGVI